MSAPTTSPPSAFILQRMLDIGAAAAVSLLALTVCLCLVVRPSIASSSTVGTAARTVSVSEAAHLRLVSRRGSKIFNEGGNGSGSFPGAVAMQMNITRYGRASISFTLSTSKGTLAGQGNATYYAAGNTAYFTGTLSITRGTDTFTHAIRQGLGIQGTFQRSTFVVSVTVTGSLSI
jgi:hypothetical protein